MKSLAIWLIIFAIASALLPLMGIQPLLVAWFDTWGPEIGWCIRGGMVLLGVSILVAMRNKS
ncbi:MAG: hypothetical protein AABZ53_08675 [Planctomycetota bacterium]